MATKEELESSAEHARNEAEFLMARSAFNSVLKSSPTIDRVATFMLVGIGATLALLIANLNQTSEFIGPAVTRIVLLMLLVTALFGILEKIMAVRIEFQVRVEQHVRAEFSQVLQDYLARIQQLKNDGRTFGVEIETSAPDFMRVMNEVATVVPWYQRRYFQRTLRESLSDRLFGFRNAGHMFNRQIVYGVLELVGVVTIVVFIAMRVKLM